MNIDTKGGEPADERAALLAEAKEIAAATGSKDVRAFAESVAELLQSKACASVGEPVAPAVTEGASLSNAELADHVEVIAAGFWMPENPQAYRNTMRARLLEAASRLRAPAAAVSESPAAERPVAIDSTSPIFRAGRWTVSASYATLPEAQRAEDWLIGMASPTQAPAATEAPSEDEQLSATLIHCSREVSATAVPGYDLASLLSRAAERIAAVGASVQPVPVHEFKQPGWHHVAAAFVEGAREARANPDADDALFVRAADGYTKRVHEEVDPETERRLRENDWPEVQPLQASLSDEQREALIDMVNEQHMTATYHCLRVWEAWNVGTMSQDDFQPASESDMAAEIVDAIFAELSKGAK